MILLVSRRISILGSAVLQSLEGSFWPSIFRWSSQGPLSSVGVDADLGVPGRPVLLVWYVNHIELLWWLFCPGFLEVGTSFLSILDHFSGPTFPTRVWGANLSEVFEAGMWSAEGVLLSI